MFNLGDVVCDIHDGVNPPSGLEVVRCQQFHAVGGKALIEQTLLHQDVIHAYLNKKLVLTGENSQGHLEALYSWDDRYLGIVLLKPV